ncbi:MAG: hypothetical protein SGPRY_000424 [Prymnesium sp.]
MRIGWIGVGVMGRHMASHLLRAGHELCVFSRTPSTCAPLIEQGATLAASPLAAAEGCQAVFTMVGSPRDVEEVNIGEKGALLGMSAGSLLVDMTTSNPSLAKRIETAASQRGVLSLDAPVSGGDVGAEAATLSIMCGGSEGAMEAARPLLSLLGKSIAHMGGAGAGQHTKTITPVSVATVASPMQLRPPRLTAVCNQILACSNMIGVTESLLYAHRAGLDPQAVVQAIGAGAAGSWAMNNLGPRVVARDFAPGFMIQHMTKDLGIALAEAEQMGLELPGLALAHKLYASLLEQGHGKDGTQALTLALEAMVKEMK